MTNEKLENEIDKNVNDNIEKINDTVEDNESTKKLSKKEIKEAKKLQKVKKLFKKRFSKRALNKKVYKKIYILSDKEFIQSFFVSKTDEKNREYFEFDKSLIKDKKQLQRVNAIAKEIVAQKGRVNFLAVLGAFACVFAVLFFIYIFRNFLTRKIVVGASEATFGAKCDVTFVDFDLLKTRFRIKGYKVANKNYPMWNLFEIENIDFYFNLLELSRGKFVAENMAIDGVTWNTQRKTSGTLPPKKQKKVDKNAKSNPAVALINKELAKIKSEISVANGLNAIQDQIDPRKILEREKASFKTLAIKDEIIAKTVPLKDKWIKSKDEIIEHGKKTIEVAKRIANINIQKIDDPKQLQELITVIVQATQTGKDDFNLAEKLSNEVKSDIKMIDTLGRNASATIKNDVNHVKDLATKIKSINVNTGKKLVSQLINSFIVETLGKYYPYFVQGVTYLKSSQQKKDPKDLTLAEKSKKLERLPGTTFIFSKHSMPSFVIKNVSLSGHYPDKNVFAIGGMAKAITNDADKLGLPLTIDLYTTHSTMKETAKGIIDLRSYSKELVDTLFTFEGLDLNLPQPAEGVPALTGVLKTSGGVKVSKAHDTVIEAELGIMKSSLNVAKFEPEFVYEIYQNILSEIKEINAKLILKINKGENFNSDVITDVDDQIARGVKKELERQVQKLKAELLRIANEWLDEQKEIYKDEIAKFMQVANQAKTIFNDFQNYEKILAKKKIEIENRLKAIAAEKAQELINEGKNRANEAIKEGSKEVEKNIRDAFKGLF